MAPPREPIAIVGASCRLAGQASSLPGLWEMMCKARSAHARVPAARWDASAWHHPDPDRKGSLTTTHGFFLDQDVAAFDAPFFSVTAKEAAGMDPVKRLLLEVAYEAFENAGMPLDQVAGSMTGVYVGSMTSDYEVLSTREVYEQPYMAAAGSSEAMTANRVSWFFDLLGPSLTLDTACSSSLYALHLACQSLLLGETDMGLVAGVNVILHPNFMGQLVAMHMLSPDGISHSFDDRANGYGRGEGIGALVVKRLSDAIRDGDTVRAVIRGSSINVDGKTPSVTMPSSDAQAALIRRAYQDAGLPLTETQYVEMHGTGTPVGDPIEMSAIAATFGAAASPEKPVFVGSIKPTVGHTEGCAGLAGVFKAILSLEHGIIVPTAEVETVNPKLRFADWNLALPPATMPWPTSGLRRVSVNSFGFGGANAHVILDDAYHYMKFFGLEGKHATAVQPRLEWVSVPGSWPHGNGTTNGDTHTNGDAQINGHGETNDYAKAEPSEKLFVVSTRDEKGLQRLAKSLAAYWKSGTIGLGHKDEVDYVSNVAYTLAARRSWFDYRSFVVASSVQQLSEQLAKVPPKLKRASKQDGVAFVFTGQGAQWAGMGRELTEFPVFAASIARSKACLDKLGCPFDLDKELADVKSTRIETAMYSQPICSAVQIALTDLMADWGVTPKAVVGHSSGEIASAYAAGIVSHEDAIKIAYLRGVYSEKAAGGPRMGAMLAAGISEEEATTYLEAHKAGSVVVACINSPKSVTLSGDADVVTALEASISKDQKFARKLRVATAYHSPHMQVVAEGCLAAMIEAGVGAPKTTSTLMFSSVTGQLIDHSEVGPQYWIRNMCSPVRFSQAVSALLTYSPGKRRLRSRAAQWTSLVEVGPHSALKAPLVQIMEGVDAKLPTQLPYTSVLVRKESATTSALKAAGHLWGLGYPVALTAVNRETTKAGTKPRPVVDLPAYPWNHEKSYWHEAAATKEQRLQHQPRTDLLGAPVENQNPFEPQWRNFLSVRENPWVEDHKITGTTLYPGAGMLIMVIEAAQQIAPKDATIEGIEFRDVNFDRGLVIPSEGAVETKLSIQTPTSGQDPYSFAVFSRLGEAPWARHCFGHFSISYKDTAGSVGSGLAALEWRTYVETYEKLKALPSELVNVKKLYKDLDSLGMGYGPTFQNLTSLVSCSGQDACYGTIAIPDTKSVMPYEHEYPHLIHPATLDAIFHLIVVAVGGGPSMTEAAVPYQLEKLYIASDLPSGAGAVFSGYSHKAHRKDRLMAADLIATDASWSCPKIILKGLVMRQVTSGGADSSARDAIRKRTTQLLWKLDPDTATRRSVSVPLEPQSFGISRLRDWLDLECHKSSKLRVLLVASSLPTTVLEELAPFTHNHPLYRGIARCTVVAGSDEELEPWKELTSTAQAAFDFRTSYPTEGTEAVLTKFDVVITGNPDAQLETLKPLLHSGSRLILWRQHVEGAVKNGFHTVPELPDGLEGTKLVLDGQDITIATLGRVPDSTPATVSLLVSDNVTADNTTGREAILRAELQARGIEARIVHLNDVHKAASEPIISLLDLGKDVINSWSAAQFEQFQQLVASASHVFWVTNSGLGHEPSEEGLRSAAMPGLLRVLRNEYPQVTLAHLDLSSAFDLTTTAMPKLVVDTWISAVQESEDVKDLELAERGGHILLPRVVAAPGLDTEVALSEGTAPAVSTPLAQYPALRLSVGDSADEVAWARDTDVDSPLDAEEVEIRVSNMSVDCDQTDVTGALGSFVTGLITRVGSSVSGLVPGDGVLAVGGQDCRTLVRRRHAAVLQLPDGMNRETAASEAWLHMMALYVLGHISRLARDETVLIQEGSTGVGQALIYAAQRVGAQVFATVGTSAEKSDLMQRFGLSDDSVVVLRGDASSLDAYLESKIGREGLDVLVASARGPALGDVLTSALSEFARVAVLGRNGTSRSRFSVHGNVQTAAIDATRLLHERPALVARLLTEVASLFTETTVPAILPQRHFSVADLPQALAWLQKTDSVGIASVHFAADAPLPVMPAPPPRLQLDGGATYVLAGGLGSLGLRIADMMAAHGAKHLSFLSRSGNRARYADRLAALEARGCGVAVFACDVGSVTAVRDTVAEITKLGRPIKGLIQCAMVLQDSLFSNMTHKQWETAFTPKVAGTWNLHAALPADLDFFVMLSSVVSVIGNVAQANYAAGNAFMDAMARFRRARGQAAVSVNAGLVRDSDHTIDGTDMADYLDRFRHMASVSTDLAELDRGLVAALRGTTADGSPTPPQFVFGMTDALQPAGPDTWATDPKFVHRIAAVDADVGAAGPGVAESLSAAASLEDATAVVLEALKVLLAPGLGVQPSDINDESPLYDIGVDSFKAVEVRNRVFRELESEISVFELLSPSTLAQTSRTIAKRSRLVPAAARAADGGQEAAS